MSSSALARPLEIVAAELRLILIAEVPWAPPSPAPNLPPHGARCDRSSALFAEGLLRAGFRSRTPRSLLPPRDDRAGDQDWRLRAAHARGRCRGCTRVAISPAACRHWHAAAEGGAPTRDSTTDQCRRRMRLRVQSLLQLCILLARYPTITWCERYAPYSTTGASQTWAWGKAILEGTQPALPGYRTTLRGNNCRGCILIAGRCQEQYRDLAAVLQRAPPSHCPWLADASRICCPGGQQT